MAGKEQGRRRSIPQTALPAPDIEIGLRRPVDGTMARYFSEVCDPFHIRRKKLRPAAYTNNHELIASKETGAFKGFALHAVDAVGIVHAMPLRIQTLLLPVQTLVLSGH